MISILVTYMFLVCYQVLGDSSVSDGLYVITSIQVTRGTDNKIVELSLASTPAGDKKVGDVLTKEYDGGAPFYWKVTRRGPEYSTLLQDANPKNIISETESGTPKLYQFVDMGNKQYQLRHIVRRRAATCVKNNGAGKRISVVNCAQAKSGDQQFLWQFVNVTST